MPYKFCIMLAFLITLTREEKIGTRSGRAGPSFSVRPEKEAKGAVLHGTSAAGRWSHEPTRSANLPKLNASRRLKHMGRFVFALRAKIPSRATQIIAAGAASACRKLLNAQSAAGNARFLQPFVTWKPLRRSQVTIGQGSAALASCVAREGISPRSGETKRLLV